jgi:coenzyme Q-binding protein COQ10
MAGASREETYEVSAEKYYAAVTDYEHYAKILTEVDSVSVKNKSEKSASIEYTITVIKSFRYTLKMIQNRPTSLTWELEEGNLFKKNSGSWTITPISETRCRVAYTIDLDLKIFAPKAVTNALVAVNLPKMMQQFADHAKTL